MNALNAVKLAIVTVTIFGVILTVDAPANVRMKTNAYETTNRRTIPLPAPSQTTAGGAGQADYASAD